MSSTIVPTLTVLQAVQALLQPLTIAPGPAIAFASVNVYPNKNVLAAIRELYANDDRICILVPTQIDYEDRQDGGYLISRATLEFAALVTDRNYGQEATAFLGDGATNPGSLALAELIVTTLIGTSPVNGTYVRAVRVDTFELRGSKPEDRDEAYARSCMAILFKSYIGESRTPIPRGMKAI